MYAFSSDCFKNGSMKLYNLLAAVLKSFLVHGNISVYLLLATLVPIIKDRLGSIQSSKNYRSIAISSLVLKLFEFHLLPEKELEFEAAIRFPHSFRHTC